MEGASLEKLALRIRRLDYLVDLVDAARFGDDHHARDALWDALGGDPLRRRGTKATQQVWKQLLDEAFDIEEEFDRLALKPPEDTSLFLADLIHILTVDIHHPDDADSLQVRVLAYRELAETGSPRLRDNARWRLYDHLRGAIAAALAESDVGRRIEIALHSLYVDHDEIEDYLADRSPHLRPPLPGPEALWSRLEAQIKALATYDRWGAVLEHRRAQDEALRETFLSTFPQARDPSWSMPATERGTGHRESFAPVLQLETMRATLEPGSPLARSYSVADPELAGKVEASLARDGRGTLLLVVDPLLPSPELYVAFKQLMSARVSTVELAVREERLDSPVSPPSGVPAEEAPEGGDAAHDSEEGVVLALPLQVVVPGDRSPGAKAFGEARIQVRLGGRGPRIAIDGQWLDPEPLDDRAFERQLARIRPAYPRERAVSLVLAPDVQYEQLVRVVALLVGGEDSLFSAVGWMAEKPSAPRPYSSAFERRLEKRLGLGRAEGRIHQPFPLREQDQQRIEDAASRLGRCLVEWESALPSRGVTFDLTFFEGRLNEVKLSAKGLRPEMREELEACVRDELSLFRLREHRDRVELRVDYSPKSKGKPISTQTK